MPGEGDANYLTTAEVARRLKIKPETVYAYVSRGLLTSTRARGRRGSLFAVSEVERLAARTVDHDGVVERIETELTLLEDDQLYYRGYSVRDLITGTTGGGRPAAVHGSPAAEPQAVDELAVAEPQAVHEPAAVGRQAVDRAAAVGPQAVDGFGSHPVERVARLLWTGELVPAEPFPAPVELVELAGSAMAVAPDGARLADQLRIAVVVLGAADPMRFDLSTDAVMTTAERLLGTLAAALPAATGRAGGPRPAAAAGSSFGNQLWGKFTSHPPQDGLLDAAVILLADHGLAVSTIAARVAANARANLYSVVSAGLGALDGQYHGAATTLSYQFLQRAKPDPVRALSDQLRTGEPVPGFGHRIYKRRDPRAEILFELLGDHPVTATVQALTERVGSFPNLDLAIAAMMHVHGFRADAGEALFAIARIVGWTAHALEEYRQPGLRFRTAGVYTGPAHT